MGQMAGNQGVELAGRQRSQFLPRLAGHIHEQMPFVILQMNELTKGVVRAELPAQAADRFARRPGVHDIGSAAIRKGRARLKFGELSRFETRRSKGAQGILFLRNRDQAGDAQGGQFVRPVIYMDGAIGGKVVIQNEESIHDETTMINYRCFSRYSKRSG